MGKSESFKSRQGVLTEFISRTFFCPQSPMHDMYLDGGLITEAASEKHITVFNVNDYYS